MPNVRTRTGKAAQKSDTFCRNRSVGKGWCKKGSEKVLRVQRPRTVQHHLADLNVIGKKFILCSACNIFHFHSAKSWQSWLIRPTEAIPTWTLWPRLIRPHCTPGSFG